MTIKIGDIGSEVMVLQRRLTAAGYQLDDDGVFGRATRDAVIAYQRDHLITMTGTAGIRTLASLAGKARGNQLTITDLKKAAESLGVSLATICAFADVESSGEGFDNLQRPRVLFERHVFYQQLVKHAGQAQADQVATQFPRLCNQKRGGYAGGELEWARLQQAITIHRQAAIESASWGMFQIMGYHWQTLGYKNADDWANSMGTSEVNHLDALTKFIRLDDKLLSAIQAGKWSEVARRYNGPAYAENEYDKKLSAAAAHFATVYPDVNDAA